MEKIDPTATFLQLSESITKASQQILQNYLDNSTGYHNDNKDIINTYSEFGTKLAANPKEMEKIQDLFKGFLGNQQELWARIVKRQFGQHDQYEPVITPAPGDKRFKAPEWDEAPYYFDFVKQSYLLVSKLMKDIIDTVDVADKSKKKLAFYTQQYIDAFSPANFVATNPEALKLAQQTNGQSLLDGFKNLLADIQKGGITQTDMTAFQPGVNIAITPGSVIFENELIQLIQYNATTKAVYEQPLLVVPPWINKYYILDLRPENSFAKYLVDQGFSTFMISWKNPTPAMGDVNFDDYVEKGVMKALEVIQTIFKGVKVNTVGYCLGGTLLGTALAIYSKNKPKAENPINTATFLATMIDFSDVGPMGDVIDQALVRKLERGELMQDGIMHGHDMEKAFNLIRANDLVWSFVVSNYLKGKSPSSFDVMYWTNDNTNLPAKMYLFYLRYMILENKLSRKNALRICDTQIDIGKIEVPSYVIGLVEDHIAPCRTAFVTTELVSGPVEYILGESGHVMGVVNPPSKKKYGFFTDGQLENGFDKWKETAKFNEGSWWVYWSEKIAKKSGKQIPAPVKVGSAKFKEIEPAPGRYVKEKCHDNIHKKEAVQKHEAVQKKEVVHKNEEIVKVTKNKTK